MSRGEIRNKNYACQINDFSGFSLGNITPTDIDGMIEYKDIAYVIIEIKYKNSELPFGQKLCLKRLADDLSLVKPCLFIACTHKEPCNDESCEDVKLIDTTVRYIRYNKKWIKSVEGQNTYDITKRFLYYVEKQSKARNITVVPLTTKTHCINI